MSSTGLEGDDLTPPTFPPASLTPFGLSDATQSGSSGDDVLHEILSHTPFLIAHCTADLRYRAVSDAYARLFGARVGPDAVHGVMCGD